jgi:xanthine dehydrogenase large subunit
LNRLKKVAAEQFNTKPESIEIKNEKILINGSESGWTWKQLVMAAYVKRVSLSEHAHYTPAGIHFDNTIEKGEPFTYHVFGTAAITVTVDCLRGIYEIDSVDIVHDFGNSMNMMVDRGQIEGGVVQGIGWMTMEELVYDKEGKLRSNALSTYKVPDIYAVPKNIMIHALETNKDNEAILKSKATGEPPLMYGIGAYFALRNAIKSFNPLAEIPFDAPMTPEKVLLNLYNKIPKTSAQLTVEPTGV